MSSVFPLLATLGGISSSAARSVLTPTVTATGKFWCYQHGGTHTGSRWNALVDVGSTMSMTLLAWTAALVVHHGGPLLGYA